MRTALLLGATLLVAMLSVASAQPLTRYAPEGAMGEVPLWRDASGRLHATRVTVKFNAHVFDAPRGATVVSAANVRAPFGRVASSLQSLRQRYGAFRIEKRAPSALWGDSLRVNRHTGRLVPTPDLSQLFALDFNSPVPVEEVVAYLLGLPDVAYAEGPFVVQPMEEPNDQKYPNQWELPRVNASRAWDLAKSYRGARPVGIALSDAPPPCVFVQTKPEDLQSTLRHVDYCTPYGNNPGHGIQVASVAGAATNNGNAGVDPQYEVSMASLAWGADLYMFDYYAYLTDLVSALGNPSHPAYGKIDVVNNSWITSFDSPTLRQNVRALLEMGIVVVGSAGNTQSCQTNGTCASYPFYPAAYSFTDLNAGNGATFSAQVIAVSGTNRDDRFIDGYKYSPGTNPDVDPTNAYIDVTAPGEGVHFINGGLCNGGVDPCYWIPDWGKGTSFSSPMVAGLAALILSVNPALGPREVYDAIVRTAADVDLARHPNTYSSNGLTWNQYTGYGRIDAYAAVKYAIEQSGGTLGEGGGTVTIHEPLTIQPGATLSFRSGTTVRVAGTSLRVRGGFSADGVTFTERDAGQGWNGLYFDSGSSGTLSNSTILNVGGGAGGAAIRTYNASPYVTSSTIQVRPGSYVFGVSSSGSHGRGARIVGSTIRSASGPAVYAGYGGYISVHTSTIEQQNSETAVLAEGQGATVAFWPPPASAPYIGYDRVRGGRLLARGNGVVDAGQGSNTTSRNHFCDAAAATLEVQSGGTIYARYDYWPNGAGPTAITGTGNVYYSNNLGPAQCGSGLFAQRAEASPWRDGASDAAESSAVGADPRLGPPRLFEALERRRVGDHAGAFGLLVEVFGEGGSHAFTALNEVARTHAEGPLPAAGQFLERVAARGGPYQAAAKVALADVRAREDRVAEAIVLLDEAAALRPHTSEAFFDRIAAFHVLLNAGDVPAAEVALARAQPTSEADVQTLAMAQALFVEHGAALGGWGRSEMGEAARAAESVVTHADGEPAEFALLPVYPNPASGAVTVPFVLPDAAEVQVIAYDMLGRRVATVAAGRYEPGRHVVRFDGASLAPGMYVVRSVFVPEGGGASRTFVQRLTLAR